MINPDDLNLKQAVRNLIALFMFSIFILVGCQGQSILDAVFPQADTQLGDAEPTVALENPVEGDEPATPTPPIFYNLVLWVPPQFDPYGDSEAAALLSERIKTFLIQNPQVNLDVRVKAVSGPGNMIETLTGASAVAQDALPSLVLISRADLVQAVSKNLLYSIDELSTMVDEIDWYGFAQNLAIYQGSAYGLPFASNALGLVFRGNALSSDQPSWEEAISQLDSLVFPAGDAEALVTSALYQSMDGQFLNQTGQPRLDSDKLASVLEIYNLARKGGLFNRRILEFQTDDQAWESFISDNSDAVVTWVNRILSNGGNLRLALLPSFGENPFTIGTGWIWCLSEPDIQERAYAASLAEFLAAPEFLAEWAPVSGFLPVRPSSLAGYADEEFQSTLGILLLSADIRPDKNITAGISTEIKTAVAEVILGTQSPLESALDTAERLEAAENQ